MTFFSLLFFLVYVEPKLFFRFWAGKFSSAAPTLETNPFGTSENMHALAPDHVSLSMDDGNQKLPAARPAVLSTAAISSSWDDDHDKGGLNKINGDQKLPAARPAVLSTAAISSYGLSEYEKKRMGNIARNNARLASLGLLVPMTSAATLSSNLSNRKKRLASQDNAERRIQPKRNAKQLTSYRDFNDRMTAIPSFTTGDVSAVPTTSMCRRFGQSHMWLVCTGVLTIL